LGHLALLLMLLVFVIIAAVVCTLILVLIGLWLNLLIIDLVNEALGHRLEFTILLAEVQLSVSLFQLFKSLAIVINSLLAGS